MEVFVRRGRVLRLPLPGSGPVGPRADVQVALPVVRLRAPPREGPEPTHTVVGPPGLLRPPQVLGIEVDTPDVPRLARRRPAPVARGSPVPRRRLLPLGPCPPPARRRPVVVPDTRVAPPVGVGGPEARPGRGLRVGRPCPRRAAAEDTDAAPAVREEGAVVRVVGPPRDGPHTLARVGRRVPAGVARRGADEDVHVTHVALCRLSEEVGERERVLADVS